MVRSLTRIKQQIEKLQKEADSIQSGIVSRLRKEIAEHGLTVEQLFGSPSTTGAADAARIRAKSKLKPKPAARAAKYADGQGNTWGGMGKRPQWVHTALEAGRSLDEFLVTAAKPAGKAKSQAAQATPSRKKTVAKTAATKKATAKSIAAEAVHTKAPAKKARSAVPPSSKRPAKKPSRRKSASGALEQAQPAI